MNSLIAFMSGPWGRGLRVVAGLVLIVAAANEGGWGWLMAIPGVMMIGTGVLNYFPVATFQKPQKERSEFMKSLGPRNLLGYGVGWHHNVMTVS